MTTENTANKLPPTRRARGSCVQDWPKLLFHFIESRRNTPFAWGRQDCCLFACDGILAQTGLDPAARMFRGKYRDALGAARLVHKHGGVEAIADKICAKLGYAEVPVLMAQRGDVVLMSAQKAGAAGLFGRQPVLGICIGAMAAFTGVAGLVFHPVGSCRKAWRIG
jgi:hypothetical protein